MNLPARKLSKNNQKTFQVVSHLSNALATFQDVQSFLFDCVSCLTEAILTDLVSIISFELETNVVTHYIEERIIFSPDQIPSIQQVIKSIGENTISTWKSQLEDEKTLSYKDLLIINIEGPQSGNLCRLIIPLLFKRTIQGVLDVSRSIDNEVYTSEEIEIAIVVANYASIALDLAKLRSIELQQRKQAETLREVAHILSSSLDLPDVLELILEQLSRVVSYDSASIMLLSSHQLSIVAHKKLQSSEQLFLSPILNTFGHVQAVIQNQRPVIIPDTQEDDRWHTLGHSDYIRCWLGVPLIGKSQVIGVLNLDKAQPGYYSQKDAEIALTFASQAALAIENAHLYTIERQRVDQLDALHATVVDISVELELSKLLQSILERAIMLLNAGGGDLGLFNETLKEILIVTSINMGKDYTGTRMSIGEGAMGLAFKTGKSVIVDDYAKWENSSNQYLNGAWKAVLAVPFIFGNRLVGAIGIVDTNPDRIFDESDEHLLSLFAQQAAIAVENARLYKSAREATDKRNILHKVSQQIVAANLDSEEIYTAIHQAAAALMPSEAFVISIIDEKQQEINAVYLVDRGGRVPSRTSPANRGLSGHVIATGKPLYIEDFTKGLNEIEVFHFGHSEEIRSILTVPMQLRGKVVGMLSAQSYEPYAYSEEDKYLLEMLASYAAIALDNANLFIRIQQMAITDPLTGLYNRRHLIEIGQREFLRAQRFRRELSVIMLDIDHFKRINDTFGHETGDKALQFLAQILKTSVREIDFVVRYGGEEFIIILPEIDLASAHQVAERLRLSVAQEFMDRDNFNLNVTISLGVAAIDKDVVDFQGLINRADHALYAAKQAGRDRVEFSNSR